MTSSKPRKSVREVALDCLSRRALTAYELETRLKEKGYENSEVNSVVKRLRDIGYLNDEELALTVAQNRLKRYSRRRVQQDLQKRGFESELIEQALESSFSGEEEFGQCFTLARRWYEQEEKRWDQLSQKTGSAKSLPRELWLQQKVARKLVQRGYPSEIIRSVVSQVEILLSAQSKA